jgi:hypothetical protein
MNQDNAERTGQLLERMFRAGGQSGYGLGLMMGALATAQQQAWLPICILGGGVLFFIGLLLKSRCKMQAFQKS